MGQRPELQKAIFQELKREHGLEVHPVTKREAVVSIEFPTAPLFGTEVGAEQATTHAMAVLGGSSSRRGSNASGSPRPGPLDPRFRLRGPVRYEPTNLTLEEWVEDQNARKPRCACGCGRRIRVRPHHHWRGIPRYVLGHHPKALTTETQRLRAEGLLTVTMAAKRLGIGKSTLDRWEGTLFPKLPRRGGRRIRVFTREQIDALRRRLRQQTRLGRVPSLITLNALAKGAGCHWLTIRRRLGTELPAGRPLVRPPGAWGFTKKEAAEILAWARRRRRRARDRARRARSRKR